MDRFDYADVSIFYTLTRAKDLTRVLYITLFDYKERTTRTYTQEKGKTVIYTGTPVVIDLEHEIIQTKMSVQTVDEKVDPIASDIDLMNALSDHHQSIVKKLTRRDEPFEPAASETVAINWDLLEHSLEEPEAARRTVTDTPGGSF